MLESIGFGYLSFDGRRKVIPFTFIIAAAVQGGTRGREHFVTDARSWHFTPGMDQQIAASQKKNSKKELEQSNHPTTSIRAI